MEDILFGSVHLRSGEDEMPALARQGLSDASQPLQDEDRFCHIDTSVVVDVRPGHRVIRADTLLSDSTPDRI
jgi:hypothetical protein